jgi:hypothetical protein
MYQAPLPLSIPTIGANLARIYSNGFDEPIQGLIFQGGKVENLTDTLTHFLASLRGSVAVFVQMLKALLAFQLHNHTAGNELHFRGASREVQVFAAIHNGWTSRADVNFLGSVFIEEFHCFPQLSATHDAIVHKK